MVNLIPIDIGQFNDKYLSKDPTLPHVDNIPCPNLECITNKINPNSEIQRMPWTGKSGAKRQMMPGYNMQRGYKT